MRPANQPPVPPQPPAPDAAGHLPLPLLRQYVAGALPPAEQHRVEAHSLSCSRCAEVLEGLDLSSPAVTDQALSELRHRLHQRVAREAAPRYAARTWQAVAAVLALLLVSTAVWWGVRRPQAPAAGSPPVAVQVPAPPPAAVETAPSQVEPASAEVAAATGPVATPVAPATAPLPAPAARHPVAPARRSRRPAVAAAPARQSAPAAASVLSDQAVSGSVAMQAPAPVVAAPNQPEPTETKAEQSRVMLAQKVGADSVSAPRRWPSPRQQLRRKLSSANLLCPRLRLSVPSPWAATSCYGSTCGARPCLYPTHQPRSFRAVCGCASQ
ncbi:zf-HC2 domain-containing protein [Hymenobacter cellulosilyticus]|uniref:Zf-HC2 domain-containing protein n=1 Tax=Hymenobacter cellulosilyticus TaxID=2932248 RepID=A0A8T9QAR0_9BACT|nr:zf-HC2 domain-containing protein [Hymenobacter cellulosilyticus]UOQ73228.1 zf-HC2 domain-containing protein [Hymenobacter cellulosilyticus]